MKSSETMISVVVPCFNEAANIPLMVSALEEVLKPWKYEVVLVDDGSTDNSPEVYRQLGELNQRIKYLRFSRNFGHQAALKAGIDHSCGDAVVTIDADLQQPPALIPGMIEKWQQGADIVEGVRQTRDRALWFKQKTAGLFYRLLGALTDYPVVKGVSDFRLIDKKVAGIVQQMPENHLYLRGLFSWMGFEHAYIDYKLEERQNGNSRYPLAKMIGLASSGMTSMSVKPLRVAMITGIGVSLVAFLYALYVIFVSFYDNQTVPGWTSTIISVLFMAGIQLIVLGIMGEYLGKMFMENKRRPVYLVADTNITPDGSEKENHPTHEKTKRKGGGR